FLRSKGVGRKKAMPSKLSNRRPGEAIKAQVHEWAKRPGGVTLGEIAEALNISPDAAARSLIGDLRQDGHIIHGRRDPATAVYTYFAPVLTSRFDHAFSYAHELHRGQVRKGTEIPYISHLMTVSALVLEHGGDEDQAIAAILHDGPEDCGGQAT